MKIAISAESTIDLPKSIIEKNGFFIVPFTVTLGTESFFDGEVPIEKMVDTVKRSKTLPKTSAVNCEQFREHFDNILKSYDAILHFSLSKELSSAYQNAVNVSKEYQNVHIFDSKTLSTGIGLEALFAKKLIDNGENFENIIEKVEKRIPYVQVSSVIDNLDYLYYGGRCSALKRFGLNLFKIKPQIVIKKGKITTGKIYRGKYENVLRKYIFDTLQEFNNPDKENVIIAYTTTDNMDFIDEVKNILKDEGFKNIIVTQAGATVTGHCGENTLGIYYINDGNNQ